ncbi:hypothetical protein [Psychromonas aquimarina]|uniref:hypothetical protein n=1 Tax=Psychromonas aquimarina TaxID=444919 RepID=UPI0004215A69|nr:hypothetical protein [Psychromonas aquimarina]
MTLFKQSLLFSIITLLTISSVWAVSFNGKLSTESYFPWLYADSSGKMKEGVNTKIHISWKIWTLLDEPVYDCIAKWDKVTQVRIRVNQNDKKTTLFTSTTSKDSENYIPQEILDKIRIYNVRLLSRLRSGSFGYKQEIPYFVCDPGVMSKAGNESSFNLPSSPKWDRLFLGAAVSQIIHPVSEKKWRKIDVDRNYINADKAKSWFKEKNNSQSAEYIELVSPRLITVQYDLSAVKHWLNKKTAAEKVSRELNSTLTDHFDNLRKQYKTDVSSLTRKLNKTNEISDPIEKMKTLRIIYKKFKAKKIPENLVISNNQQVFENKRTEIDKVYSRNISAVTSAAKSRKSLNIKEKLLADDWIAKKQMQIKNRPALPGSSLYEWNSEQRKILNAGYETCDKAKNQMRYAHARERDGFLEGPELQSISCEKDLGDPNYYLFEYRWKFNDLTRKVISTISSSGPTKRASTQREANTKAFNAYSCSQAYNNLGLQSYRHSVKVKGKTIFANVDVDRSSCDCSAGSFFHFGTGKIKLSKKTCTFTMKYWYDQNYVEDSSKLEQ